MSTSRASRRLWYALAAVVCAAVVAVAVAVALLREETSPPPEQARFTGYSLVKTGGIAGVRHHVEVSADGTVLYADDRPVAGRLSRKNMDRLATLLADRRLAKENGKAGPGTTCADAFTYTLTAGATKVAKDDCGSDADTPLLDEIIALTAKEDLQPLPDSAPKFRGLKVTYYHLWEKEDAKIRIDADGSTKITKNGGPVRRDRLDTGTLDALRVLYTQPLTRPSNNSDVGCIPERPVYKITPKGGPTITESPCGRQEDYRWKARLTIIGNLIPD